MTALRNILSDLIFQFRIRGALLARLGYVSRYYALYIRGRLAGKSRDQSRFLALQALARSGRSFRLLEVRWPLGMRMRMDALSASLLLIELVRDSAYQHLPGFRPQPGQTVVDVGAHQGTYSLLAAGLIGPSGKVVAIEPLKDNVALLRENAGRNGLSNVFVVETAVSDAPGKAKFFRSPLTAMGSLVMEAKGDAIAEVECRTLDDVLAGLGVGNVDLIKIDVEGACMEVLRGAARTLAGGPKLALEVEQGADEMARISAFLAPLGYRASRVGPLLYAECA